MPHQRITVKFIPVFEEDEQKIFEKEIISYDVSRSLDHNIRSDVYCWCDNYTLAAACHGLIHRFYVIELNINSWNNNHPYNKKCIDENVAFEGHPIYANEYGTVFIRQFASVIAVKSVEELESMKKLSNYQKSIKLEDIKEEEHEEEFFMYESV